MSTFLFLLHSMKILENFKLHIWLILYFYWKDTLQVTSAFLFPGLISPRSFSLAIPSAELVLQLLAGLAPCHPDLHLNATWERPSTDQPMQSHATTLSCFPILLYRTCHSLIVCVFPCSFILQLPASASTVLCTLGFLTDVLDRIGQSIMSKGDNYTRWW